MTLGTTDCLSQPNSADGTDAICEHAGLVILGLRAALLGGQQQPIESRSHLLLEAAVGQEIARELFASKFVKSFILIEGLDHVIAIWPDVARIIGMIPNGVGVSHNIKPANGHPFAIMRR